MSLLINGDNNFKLGVTGFSHCFEYPTPMIGQDVFLGEVASAGVYKVTMTYGVQVNYAGESGQNVNPHARIIGFDNGGIIRLGAPWKSQSYPNQPEITMYMKKDNDTKTSIYFRMDQEMSLYNVYISCIKVGDA